jgi:hypothetical protein
MVAISGKAERQGKSLHDSIIGALPKPYWLKNASLLDNVWMIQTGDETTHQHVTFDFATPITSWPKLGLLTDTLFERDLITVKTVMVNGLKPRPAGWLTTASSVREVFSAQIDFIRWRVDRGVQSNSGLSAEWFNEFDASFKKNAREGLLRLADRALPVLQAVKSGTLHPEVDDRRGIAGNPFARLIGVTNSSSLTSASRFVVEEFFRVNKIRFTRTAKARKQNVTVKYDVVDGNAFKFYRVWYDLWRLRDSLSHDAISYRAFKSRRNLSRHVRNFCEPSARTEDAPAYQTSCLINSSLKLLLDPVADMVLDLVEGGGIDREFNVSDAVALSECNKRLRALDLPELSTRYYDRRWRQQADLTIYQFIFVLLPVAARIVTAAFSARRDEEIASSAIDCIQIDGSGDTWLNCMILKNADHPDLVPVPKSVARSVEIVRRIRALGGKASRRLYDFACPILKRPVKFSIRHLLDRVRDYLKVPLLDDGMAWTFKPHQFRKFFAVTYFWRWAFPDLTALTYHLRHFNPDTTRAYIEMKAAEGLRMRDEKLADETRKRNTERKSNFDSTKAAFVHWTLREVANGGELSGSLGKRINARVDALKAEFLSEVQITEVENDAPSFDRVLSELAGTVSLEPHPEGHSLCGWGTGPADIEQNRCMSKCLQLREAHTGQSSATASGPDFGFADDICCLVCPLRAALPVMTPRWEEEVRGAEQALIDAEDELAPIIIERIRMINEYA